MEMVDRFFDGLFNPPFNSSTDLATSVYHSSLSWLRPHDFRDLNSQKILKSGYVTAYLISRDHPKCLSSLVERLVNDAWILTCLTEYVSKFSGIETNDDDGRREVPHSFPVQCSDKKFDFYFWLNGISWWAACPFLNISRSALKTEHVVELRLLFISATPDVLSPIIPSKLVL